MSTGTIIETSRTLLRLFHDGDLADLCALHLDPDAMRFIGGGVRAGTIEVARDLAMYIEHQKTHGYSRWAVINRADDAFMGRAGFLYFPERNEIDLGYALRPEYWGMGIASEIAVAIAAWARENLPIDQVIGMAAQDNVASIKILKKIGMTFVSNEQYRGMDVQLYRFEMA